MERSYERDAEVVVFSDCGLDDAIALCYLFEKTHFGRYVLVATGGNVKAEAALRNIDYLVSHLKPRASVTVVDTCEVKQNYREQPQFHGKDGMGDLCRSPAPTSHSKVTLAEWLDEERTSTTPVYIFNLGPCTILDGYLKEINISRIKTVYMMIAALYPELRAEFNYTIDPASFHSAVRLINKNVLPLRFVPTEVCRQDYFDILDYELTGEGLPFDLVFSYQRLKRLLPNTRCTPFDLISLFPYFFSGLFLEEERDFYGEKVSYCFIKDPCVEKSTLWRDVLGEMNIGFSE